LENNQYSNDDAASVANQVKLRRTFAIISHPDAGKTTLTEKLLLYSGMVRTAGMVRGRKGSKATSSDWMAMEQERGISITASAMQFRYKDAVINVLDTPGHQDFSEDTYRTLTAADCAIMVIDAAKGVEEQTKKLFAVCRMQRIPILTFVNKLDLPARDMIDLLHEVETVLGIQSSPLNWPIGYGRDFVGLVDRRSEEAIFFNRSDLGGSQKATADRIALAAAADRVDASIFQQTRDELELLDIAGNQFEVDKFLEGAITPVFFGSALTNFGIEPFFDAFLELAPSPRPYRAHTVTGEEILVDPIATPFSGYVFKIQANMNPKHRDSMAFIRVCSGRFERDMVVRHHRAGKDVRLSRSYAMVAQDRDTVDYAFPGDIVGAINPGVFAIGDTISLSGDYNFLPMPQFPPEVLAQVRPKDAMRRKSFEKGLQQLSDEGAIQILKSYEFPDSAPFVAAVGKLQFEVLQYRLKEEYGVQAEIDFLPYRYSSYLKGDPKTLRKTQGSYLALDRTGRVVLLCTSEWEKRYISEQNSTHKLEEFLTS
jgi:peptide chain release factor 3